MSSADVLDKRIKGVIDLVSFLDPRHYSLSFYLTLANK